MKRLNSTAPLHNGSPHLSTLRGRVAETTSLDITHQTGTVDISVEGADAPVTVTPGTGLHIGAKITHSLTALESATVTLLVLD